MGGCGDTEARPHYAAVSGPSGAGGNVVTIADSAASADGPENDGGIRPCATESSLVLETTTPSSVSRPGAVYSAAPLDQYWPRPIGVRLTTTLGNPLRGCEVQWTPASGSGWVFPIASATDADGRVDAWWTAGEDPSQSVTAKVALTDGGDNSVVMLGTTQALRTTAERVYIQYPVDPFDAYSVEVTPLLAPAAGFFGALLTSNCGAGLYISASNDAGAPEPRAFAYCWDSDSDVTTVIDAATTTCGPILRTTGTYCTRAYSWKTNAIYRFDLETNQRISLHTDFAFFVTDSTTNERTKLVELRFGSADRPSAAYSYLQDNAFADSCLAAAQHATLFGHVTKTDRGVASEVKTATFTRDFDPSVNDICANYAYGVASGQFFLSTGADRVGPPRLPGSSAPVIVLP